MMKIRYYLYWPFGRTAGDDNMRNSYVVVFKGGVIITGRLFITKILKELLSQSKI